MAKFVKEWPVTHGVMKLTIDDPDGVIEEIISDPRTFYRNTDYEPKENDSAYAKWTKEHSYPDVLIIPKNGSYISNYTRVRKTSRLKYEHGELKETDMQDTNTDT